MTQKYKPLRYELTVVETFPCLPDNIEQFKQEMIEKYGEDVVIHKHEYIENHWSWRTDSSYSTNEVRFQIKAMRPVYSDEDANAMFKEERQKAIEDFKNKYAKWFKPVDGSSK